MDNFANKFSPNLKKVLLLAERIAGDLQDSFDTHHLVFAIIAERNNLAAEILNNFDITPAKVDVLTRLISKEKSVVRGGLSNDLKTVLLQSVKTATNLSQQFVETEHLLYALLSDKNLKSYQMIERAGANPEKIKYQLKEMFNELRQALDTGKEMYNSIDQGPMMQDGNFEVSPLDEMPAYGPSLSSTQAPMKEKTLLEIYGTNLNESALSGILDPVVGRESEISRLIQILSRRTKNNPILLGEPGVGKTSIVEGLADRIVKGKAPASLIDKKIIMLDLGAIVAGTMFRGQFEGRLKKLIEEIQADGNIILFLDEIHTVIGAGSAEGSLDAANLLKPQLSKGNLRLIGATTFDEYKKNIEKDKAFERRFQIIKIAEPAIPETIRILHGLRQKYEKYHGISYSHEAIDAAVKLSDRYIPDRFLPDKAIDLIDEAAAALNILNNQTPELFGLKKRLNELLRLKDQSVSNENYQKATEFRQEELQINERIKSISLKNRKNKITIVSAPDIAKVVADSTGIPVTDLKTSENLHLVRLELRLKKEIIGQDNAVKAVAEAIKRSRVGISDPNRPIGSFIFLGPTGVGKTELARVLAKLVFGSEKSLVKIDMSEFMEKHNVSRLVGSPAGYVGFEEGGKLTETIRHQPYSLVLFDEIEKAHPDVFNILLQILEDGYITDAKGRRVNFKHSLIILTTNLGSKMFFDKGIGFISQGAKSNQALSDQVIDNFKKNLPPEFINRLDKIIVFNRLEPDQIKKIVTLRLNELIKRLKTLKIDLVVTTEAKNLIASKGFDPEFGARPLKRLIANELEAPISDLILKYKNLSGKTIKVDVFDESLKLSLV